MWETGPPLPQSLDKGCVVALNDNGTKHILIGAFTANVWTYDWDEDISTRAWHPAPARSTDSEFAKCTRVLLDGGTSDVVVVAGGRVAGEPVSTVDIYNILTRLW